MDNTSFNAILSTVGIITAVATAWYSIQKIFREYNKNRRLEADKILEEAKEFDKELRIRLEAKIDLLEVRVNNLETSVGKDLTHIKENQANEIRNLASRIDALREELREGNSSLITLLTQIVTK